MIETATDGGVYAVTLGRPDSRNALAVVKKRLRDDADRATQERREADAFAALHAEFER